MDSAVDSPSNSLPRCGPRLDPRQVEWQDRGTKGVSDKLLPLREGGVDEGGGAVDHGVFVVAGGEASPLLHVCESAPLSVFTNDGTPCLGQTTMMCTARRSLPAEINGQSVVVSSWERGCARVAE